LLLLGSLWIYLVDSYLRKNLLFYETQLVDIQKKEIAYLTNNAIIKNLIQQKEFLQLQANNTRQISNTFWQQGTDILTEYAQANQLTVDTITITKQMGKEIDRKRIFSLTVQGPILKMIKFLEDIQQTKYLTLETFYLHIETKHTGKIDCSYSIKKIKIPSTHNKLKG
jgi:hypothetical protein